MEDEIAISVKSVSKNFSLPHEKADSVKSLFVNPFSKNRKKTEIQHALKNISFDVKKGEFFGIVGRNGSGKSTLLKIISGIYQPNKGKVSVNGRLVPFIELGVGFNPELTGRENTYLNGALLGFSEKEVDAKYSSIVDFAELERFMDQKLKNYSSGMQVRLAFSVATILAESDILLIDEVLAVGDADFQRKCFQYFKKLKKDKKTVIFVSHDMGAIREYCDRVILVDDSVIKDHGSTEKVAEAYVKMFNESIVRQGTKDQRWGNAQIQYKAPPKINIESDKITIMVESESSGSHSNVIYGFLIENQAREPVVGTSSLISTKKSDIVENNTINKIEWGLANIFSSGEYLLTVSITSSDGVTTYDWWSNVIRFSINNQSNTPYIVSPTVVYKNEKRSKL